MRACRQTIFLIPALVAGGCNSSDETVFKKGGNNEVKPSRPLLDGAEGLAGSDATADAKTAATVTYLMKVTSESGAAVCEGEATVKIMTNFALSFPKAEIDCLSLKVDLAKALDNGGVGIAGDSKDAGENIVHDGKVFSLKKLANADFEPARPMLLGPIVQDPTKFKNFKKTTNHTLTGKNIQTGNSISGSGSFTIEVLDHQTTYKNKFIEDEFKNVLHWRMTSSGFKDIPAQTGLVFKRWEWVWNTRPIMIPKISITGRLSDFIKGEGAGNTDALVGELQIDLIVKDYTIEKD